MREELNIVTPEGVETSAPSFYENIGNMRYKVVLHFAPNGNQTVLDRLKRVILHSQLFLGGTEPTTLKDLSQALGKETIDMYSTGENRGNNPSYSMNYQKNGKELMTIDELAVMDGDKCILQLRGVRPFLSDKYDVTRHPLYKETGEYDDRNKMDIQKYVHQSFKVKKGEMFDVMRF